MTRYCFKIETEGYEPGSAFEELVNEVYRNHRKAFWSDCRLGECKLSYRFYSYSNREEAYKFVERAQGGWSGFADYIDLGIAEFHVLNFKLRFIRDELPHENSEFLVKFCPKYFRAEIIKSFRTRKEAEDFAMIQTYLTKSPHQVVTGTYQESTQTLLSETYIEKEIFDSFPEIEERAPYCQIKGLHKYLFYGASPEPNHSKRY